MLRVTPQEFVEREVAKPGQIISSNRPGTWLARAINLAQSVASGQNEVWQHTMRMGRGGKILSQERVLDYYPVERWRGARFLIWDDLTLEPEQLLMLVDLTEARIGTKYDYPGTLAQLFTWLPWVGDWLAARLDVPWRNFCSEGVCEVQRKVTPGFGGQGACQKSPAALNSWMYQRPSTYLPRVVEII